MKNVLLLAAGLVALGGLFVSDFGSSVRSQNRSTGSYSVRIYNLDGVAVIYINDDEIQRFADKREASLDITPSLGPGPNRLRLVIENNDGGGYAYGLEVIRDGDVISSFECGVGAEQGCSNSKRTGIVFDKTITIDTIPFPSNAANWASMPGNYYEYNSHANLLVPPELSWTNAGMNSRANSVANVVATSVHRAAWRGGVPTLINKQITETDRDNKTSVTARYPQIATGSAGRWFNSAVLELVEMEIASFKNSLDVPLPDERPRVLDVKYRATHTDPRVISVIFTFRSETGGDRPAVYTLVQNYDLRVQVTLELASLFRPGTNYLDVLSTHCIQSLRDKVSSLEMLRRGAGATDFNYSSWLITPSGLEITFDADQVAPYAEGPKTVVVPYSLLKPILRPRGPISHLVK